jgi:hypothetical protein
MKPATSFKMPGGKKKKKEEKKKHNNHKNFNLNQQICENSKSHLNHNILKTR